MLEKNCVFDLFPFDHIESLMVWILELGGPRFREMTSVLPFVLTFYVSLG
jgi:hypothetical protein